MREISPGLAAHLAGGVTTLARCWTLVRRDGAVMGFTDHDRDLSIEGVSHLARAGLEAAEAGEALGFAAASADVVGVLQSAGIRERDIAAGLYDSASVTVRIVDWSNPSNALVTGRFQIGEISRSDNGFVVELRSMAHAYDEERGRIYTSRCDADLGDTRCKVALTPISASVQTTDGRRRLVFAGLQAFASGWFNGGRLAFLTGQNAGLSVEIRQHLLAGASASIDLWLEAAHPVAVADQVTLSPGCDKRFSTCASKFANALNFQGFPHIPGSDFLLQRAEAGEGQIFDGGSLFR